MSKSLIDYAFDFINSSKGQVSFNQIWAYIVKEADLTEEQAADKVAQFYTNLMLDGRFVTLGENQWDLRVRHTFDKVHIDMKDVYSDVDSSEDVDIEDEEEKEYRETFEDADSADSDSDDTVEPESSEEDTL